MTSEIYPYALDQSAIGQSALTEAVKLAASEVGLIYVKADGTLRFEGRHGRVLSLPSLWAITDSDLQELDLPSTRDEIINTVRVTIHRRLVDELPTTVVYSQVNPIPIQPGETKFLLGPYRDPVTGDPIGGTAIQTQVSGTDYVGNLNEDGTGSDVSAYLTVVVTAGGAGASFSVTNALGATVYLTRNQLRGKGIYDRGTITLEASDAPSVASFGEHAVEFDMPYQSSPDVGQGAADYLLSKYASAYAQARLVQVVGRSNTQVSQILSRDISDKVTITETVTGVSNDFFINGLIQRLTNGVLTTVYLLAPAIDPFLDPGGPHGALYWVLGTSTLGTDTTPAPF